MKRRKLAPKIVKTDIEEQLPAHLRQRVSGTCSCQICQVQTKRINNFGTETSIVDVYTEGKSFNECFEQNKEYVRSFIAQQA
jgi:hypothetical protein